jgi:hypothetical protein
VINHGWTFNETRDGIWVHEHFNTKDEAVTAALKYAKEDENQPMYIGQVEKFSVPNPIDAETLLTRAAEILDEEGGSEWDAGDAFCENITAEQEKDLETMLEETYYKWVEKHEIETNSFGACNIEVVSPQQETTAVK